MTTLKADESISKYGFLQEGVKMNDGDNGAELAKKNLDELNKEDETYSGEIIEELASYTRAGSTIEKDGVKYVITSSQHSIKNGVHYNKIDMERLVGKTESKHLQRCLRTVKTQRVILSYSVK